MSTDQDEQDAQDLAMMGHTQSLTRKFSPYSMFSLAFCVLGRPLSLDSVRSLYAC